MDTRTIGELFENMGSFTCAAKLHYVTKKESRLFTGWVNSLLQQWKSIQCKVKQLIAVISCIPVT